MHHLTDLRIIAVIICVGAGYTARAGESFTVYWENDGTFLKPNGRTDRHYTDGLKLVYTHQPEWEWLRNFGSWNNFGDDKKADTAVGYFFGQNMYTPDHADNPRARRGSDRVFAGWLYGGVFAQRATEKRMEHFELNLGIIGQSAQGGEIQRFVHKIVGQPKPKGWEDQINDEFAIDFTWFGRQRADALFFEHTSNYDSHLEYGFTAGSVHRNAILGVIFRAGENLPDDFGPGRLEAPDCATGAAYDKATHFYLFSRIGGKLVEEDRFLTGLDEEPAVGQVQIGAALRYKSFEITYTQTYLTREYAEQHDADSFASLVMSYRF